MGRYGQAILTIVGTVIGYYFGYPALGAALGSLAGSLLFPTKLPTASGPRLADLTSTASSVGTPIPEGWGCFTVPGCIIHQTNVREVIESDNVGGGSGGPSQKVETPTYFSDWALGLVDCPDEPIAGVRTIWFNGKPGYDRRPRRDDETIAQFNARMATNAQLEEQMTVYLGTDAQEPDPTLEAFYGVGNVSAHVRLAYIVFSNWQHKAEDGNRIPTNIKVECFTAGSVNDNAGFEWSNELLDPWLDAPYPANPLNVHTFTAACPPGGTYDNLADAKREIEDDYAFSTIAPLNEYLGYGHTAGDNPSGTRIGYTVDMGATTARSVDAQKVYLHYGSDPVTIFRAVGGPTLVDFLDSITGLDPSVVVFTNFDPPTGCQTAFEYVYVGATVPPPDTYLSRGDGTFYRQRASIQITVERIPRAPTDPALDPNAQPIPGSDQFVILNGSLTQVGPWVLHSVSPATPYRVLSAYTHDTFVVLTKPLNPALPYGHSQYNDETFWQQEYQKAAALHLMDEGLVYGIDYPVAQNFAYRRAIDTRTYEVAPIPLAPVVAAIFRRGGYTDEQLDVADLGGLTLMGYVRTRQMTPRAAVDPLRQAKFFDGYESGRTVRFIRRGGPIRHTFTEDELGVFVTGTDRPSRVTSRKLQDAELPRQVRVHYLSQSRDYETGEQLSPARVNTDAINDVDVEIPMVLEDEEAAQIAQVLWADAWASRWLHDIQVSIRWQELEPTDCIEIPVDGALYRTRILEASDSIPAFRKFSLVRDDDGSYESFAVADVPPFNPPPLPFLSPAGVVLLDIPMIRDSDDDPGFYAAFYPLVTGSFGGASLYRSTDSGGNWSRITGSSSAAVTGVVKIQLPAGGYTVPDGNELLVQLDDSTNTLDSITREAMLNGSNGSNAAAIGGPGRWEIVQFQVVEDFGDGLVRLTTLLRGRRGTEHVIGTALEGDRFVLLTGPGIVRVPLQLSDVGRTYLYRAVGAGLTVDSATDIEFAGEGVALKPFSPVFIRGVRDPVTGDWSITWIRRGRIGQTLPGGSEIPLSEEREEYEVVIRDADGLELRVISVVTAAASYTADQQVTDFGYLPNPIAIEVYQISASVGRGYIGTATLSTLVPVLGDTDTLPFVAGSPDDPMSVGGG